MDIEDTNIEPRKVTVTLPGVVEPDGELDSHASFTVDLDNSFVTVTANGTSVTVILAHSRAFWEVKDALQQLAKTNHGWRYRPAAYMAMRRRRRIGPHCPDCGKQGERKGHQDCQFPS